MPQKYRLTGCAKFFLFLLIATPLAYFGAYYMNTGDPMSGLRALGIGTGEVTEESAPVKEAGDQIDELKDEIRQLKADLEACRGQQNDSLN